MLRVSRQPPLPCNERLGPRQAHLPRAATLPNPRHLFLWRGGHPRRRDLLQDQRRRSDASFLHEHREPLGPLDVHRQQRRIERRPEEQRLRPLPLLHRRQNHRGRGDHRQQDCGVGRRQGAPHALAAVFRPKQRGLPPRAQPLQERLRQQGSVRRSQPRPRTHLPIPVGGQREVWLRPSRQVDVHRIRFREGERARRHPEHPTLRRA